MLLDISMPERSGMDILRHINAHYSAVSVLVTSGLPEDMYAVNALRAGAKGYLSKGSDPEEFLRAVRMVLGGRYYVSASLAEKMAADLDSLRRLDEPLHTVLSDREFQIFCKVAAGLSVSDIAAELCVSVKTVSTYRTRIMEKMMFRANADIIAYALRNGLIQ